MITASSYSSDDDVSLGSNQEEASASTHDAISSSTIPKCRDGVPSQQGQCPRKYIAHWKDDLFNVSLFWSFFYLSWFVFNNLWTTNISLILLIFRFIKIEPARVITSVFKLLIEIPLFQLSQVCRHPDWKPYIDAWFRRFGVSVNLKF